MLAVGRWVTMVAVVGLVSSSGRASERPVVDPFFVPSPALFGRALNARTSVVADGSPSFAKRLVLDFKRVVTTKDNLIILGLGAGSALAVNHYDQRVAHGRFNGELNAGGRLDKVFEGGEIYGGVLVQGLGAMTVWGVGRLTNRPGVQELGSDLVRAQIVNQVLTQALKYSAGRERPDGSNKRSFPSGHSSGAFATATVFYRHYGWRGGIPAYALASYTAASRLNESKHFLSDVVFGAAIGILAAHSVTVGRGDRRFAVIPAPASGGGVSVQLTWLGAPQF